MTKYARRRRPPPPPWYKVLGRCILCLSCGPCMCVGAKANKYLRKLRKEKLGYEEWYQRWPEPVPESSSTTSKRSMRLLTFKKSPQNIEQEKKEMQALGFFRLPFEIRMAIYDLIFPFEEIHLAKILYKGNISEYRLESYPCIVSNPKQKRDFMCHCLLGESERYARIHDVNYYRNPRFFPEQRSKSQGSWAGLWEVMSIMYVSRAFHKDILSFLFQHRTFQFFDLESIITFGVAMPRTHFHSIRSVYLNAKYIMPRSSFTGPISHFPRSYRNRFAHLSAAPPQRPMQPVQHTSPKDARLQPRHTSTWQAACHILGQMSSLNVLKMQLCHSAFSDVLFADPSGNVVSNEKWVFEPLRDIARKRGEGIGLFEVEVDWPAGDEGYNEEVEEFQLTRIGPRRRGW